jgi:hypothetical protein
MIGVKEPKRKTTCLPLRSSEVAGAKKSRYARCTYRRNPLLGFEEFAQRYELAQRYGYEHAGVTALNEQRDLLAVLLHHLSQLSDTFNGSSVDR